MRDGEEEVGYKKPPMRTRFKKGQSGNPAGRPRNSKNLDTLMLQELDRKIQIKVGPVERRISKREAIARRIVDGALKGNPRQLEFLFRYMRELGIPDPFDITADDRAELKIAFERLAARGLDVDEEGASDERS